MRELGELAAVRIARAELEERERLLIERARRAGASWAEVAEGLGLTSRQAAQQRYQRLTAIVQARRLEADRALAPRVAQVRLLLTALQRWIDADRDWDVRFVRARLIRSTLATALEAEPGAMFSLVTHLAGDLAATGPRLPRPAAAIARQLSMVH
jgi:hypothetical protein